MKPLAHACLSAHKHGGHIDDYLDIHNFLDSSKAHVADSRHRALLHNSWGCFLTEQVFGVHRTNSAGRTYSVRDIAEEHIIQDLHRIPNVNEFLEKVPEQDWMGAIKTPHQNVD